jgi:Sigma-70 region 2
MKSEAVVRQFRRLLEPGTIAGLTERQVLERFAERGDPVAFEAIVARHGPLVFAVCRQLLRDPNDVDDAFQGTFLIFRNGT